MLMLKLFLGHVKSIGVSNYTIRHLEELKMVSADLPSVLQVFTGWDSLKMCMFMCSLY